MKRKLLLEKIRLEGNFVYNMEVLQQNKGSFLILRRSSKKKSKAYSDYIQCIYCLGFLCKSQAYKHMLHCNHKEPEFNCEQPTHHSKLILAAMSLGKGSDQDYAKFISNIRDGPVKEFMKTDKTRIQLGTSLLKRKGKSQKKHISNKLRPLATFSMD